MNVAKVLVSLEDGLLKWVDRTAKAAGLSRSAFLARMLERERAEVKGPGADPHVRRALREMDRLFATNRHPGDPTALIRADRDSH
jgi:hypothetical protein